MLVLEEPKVRVIIHHRFVTTDDFSFSEISYLASVYGYMASWLLSFTMSTRNGFHLITTATGKQITPDILHMENLIHTLNLTNTFKLAPTS